MDFITNLPPCGEFNGVYTCINKLIKFINLVSVKFKEGALSAPEATYLFYNHVVHSFRFLYIKIYNLYVYFIMHFLYYLWEFLGSQISLLLDYHPQLDI